MIEITKIQDIIDYFKYHNKNLTNKQYDLILNDLQEIHDNLIKNRIDLQKIIDNLKENKEENR